MKMKRVTVMLCVVLWGLLAQEKAFAFYNPSTGRWLNRDPIQDHAFGAIRVHNLAPSTFRPVKTIRPRPAELDVYQGNPYQFVFNAPANYYDYDGLWVVCCRSGDPDPDDPSLVRLALPYIRHCELNPGSSCPNGYNTYPVTKSNTGKMDNGKCCNSATDTEIATCINKRHPYSAGTGNIGNNCQTSVIQGLGNCCLKSTWSPNWYAGDPNGLCLEWRTIWVRDREGGMVQKTICVKYQLYPVNQTCSGKR